MHSSRGETKILLGRDLKPEKSINKDNIKLFDWFKLRGRVLQTKLSEILFTLMLSNARVICNL